MDQEWADILLDIQHIITMAGADPEQADPVELEKLTAKMKAYAEGGDAK